MFDRKIILKALEEYCVYLQFENGSETECEKAKECLDYIYKKEELNNDWCLDNKSILLRASSLHCEKLKDKIEDEKNTKGNKETEELENTRRELKKYIQILGEI